MITCEYSGRLGNNMFQAATTLAYAERHGLEVAFPPHEYLDLPQRTKEPIHVYNEPYHAYKEIPKMTDLRLVGYFQSEKYFKDYKDLIREKFIKRGYLTYNFVAVHVRRGDYLQYPDKHPEPDLYRYYYKAMCEIFPLRNFLIFTDDIEHCKIYFDKNNCLFSWELYPGLNDYEYLQLMASCSDFIIANSSYSWWGAWLSNNPNKKVICPSYNNWFGKGNAHLYPNDIIPEDWTQIEY